MIDIIRKPDDLLISTDNYPLCRKAKGVTVRFEIAQHKLKLFVSAKTEKPKFILLRWNYKTAEEVKVFGDKWERSYADLFWSSINPELFMPWYFFVSSKRETTGIGVEVGAHSFVSFEYDSSGVSAWVDVRCGAQGVWLDGRELLACTFVNESYTGISSFAAAKLFCNLMSPNPKLPDHIVYGSNNWYYAYGKSSREDILRDSEFLANLSEGLKNRPYMVIDDGWSLNLTDGPWLPNDTFGDMKTLANEMRKKGVRPGIWVRLLANSELSNKNPKWQLKRECQTYTPPLDPSHPEVQEYLRQVLRSIKEWGFELLKHDYSTCDLFEGFGFNLNGSITNEENWTFFDNKKTSAEITLDFYRLIREECQDMVVISCDTIPHLSAGIFELCRIGDDTSGKSWSRTRALGVNSLAFRL
ncbi:MAG: alpha-galactosidase, partial [Ruminococcaceae bacterium]|nr:alpha-galactosidase [Oscillospiraceae bacterium]